MPRSKGYWWWRRQAERLRRPPRQDNITVVLTLVDPEANQPTVTQMAVIPRGGATYTTPIRAMVVDDRGYRTIAATLQVQIR